MVYISYIWCKSMFLVWRNILHIHLEYIWSVKRKTTFAFKIHSFQCRAWNYWGKIRMVGDSFLWKQGSLTYIDGKEKLNLQSPKKSIFTKIGMYFHWEWDCMLKLTNTEVLTQTRTQNSYSELQKILSYYL